MSGRANSLILKRSERPVGDAIQHLQDAGSPARSASAFGGLVPAEGASEARHEAERHLRRQQRALRAARRQVDRLRDPERPVQGPRAVDTSREWVESVVEQVGHDPRLDAVHVDVGETGDWGTPLTYDHRDNFPVYAQSIWERDVDPDLVLVDGRFRVLCFLHSLLRARPGTHILFDDYVDRPHYHVVEEILPPVTRNARQRCSSSRTTSIATRHRTLPARSPSCATDTKVRSGSELPPWTPKARLRHEDHRVLEHAMSLHTSLGEAQWSLRWTGWPSEGKGSEV